MTTGSGVKQSSHSAAEQPAYHDDKTAANARFSSTLPPGSRPSITSQSGSRAGRRASLKASFFMDLESRFPNNVDTEGERGKRKQRVSVVKEGDVNRERRSSIFSTSGITSKLNSIKVNSRADKLVHEDTDEVSVDGSIDSRPATSTQTSITESLTSMYKNEGFVNANRTSFLETQTSIRSLLTSDRQSGGMKSGGAVQGLLQGLERMPDRNSLAGRDHGRSSVGKGSDKHKLLMITYGPILDEIKETPQADDSLADDSRESRISDEGKAAKKCHFLCFSG